MNLKNVKLAFDIGAYDGGYANCLLEQGVNKLVCVEPSPFSFERLKQRHLSNDNVTVLNSAVSDMDRSELPFYASKRHPTISTLAKEWTTNSRFANDRDEAGIPYEWDGVETVSSTTIDLLISMYGVPEFIKIDVEGHEESVLKGLTKHYPGLTLGFEFAEEFIESLKKGIEHLHGLGYNSIGIVEGDEPGKFPDKYHNHKTFMDKMNKIFPTTNKLFFGMIYVKD